MSTLILGIDVSKDVLDACLLVSPKPLYRKFKNTNKGFVHLVQWLHKQETVSDLHVCMEATGRYSLPVAEYLFVHNIPVSIVNPARIKSYRDSGLFRNKTDKLDAFVIANFCSTQKLSLWQPPSPEMQELKELTRYLDDLLKEVQQVENRLKSGIRSEYVILNLQEQVADLRDKIAAVKKQIKVHIKNTPSLHEKVKLLESIKGIGLLTAARLLAEVQDFSRFDTVGQLDAYAGLSPRLFQSGSSVNKKARLSKRGNACLRKALFYPAMVAMRYNPIIKAFAERLSEKGKPGKVIVGACMRKLLHLAFGVLKTGKMFDPNYLNASISS